MSGLRWKIKYGLLRRKHNPADVRDLMQYMDAGMSEENVARLLLLRNNKKKKQIREMLYIYRTMNKTNNYEKGGIKNE